MVMANCAVVGCFRGWAITGAACTPRQRHKHHRRGITTPEVQSSYHGSTTPTNSVFNSLARKVDIKLLPQKSNRKDPHRATVDERLPKLPHGTPLRMRIALRRSESTVSTNDCPKVSFAKPIREVHGNGKLCGRGMLQRVGDNRCCLYAASTPQASSTWNHNSRSAVFIPWVYNTDELGL